jgi:hypothetical protein
LFDPFISFVFFPRSVIWWLFVEVWMQQHSAKRCGLMYLLFVALWRWLLLVHGSFHPSQTNSFSYDITNLLLLCYYIISFTHLKTNSLSLPLSPITWKIQEEQMLRDESNKILALKNFLLSQESSSMDTHLLEQVKLSLYSSFHLICSFVCWYKLTLHSWWYMIWDHLLADLPMWSSNNSNKSIKNILLDTFSVLVVILVLFDSFCYF